MRLGGLGQLWQTLLKLLSIMFVCQLLSPVVAFMAILLVGTENVVRSEATELRTEAKTEPSVVSSESSESSESTVVAAPDSCCVGPGQSAHSPCPSDHQPLPHLCQEPRESCSSLSLSCLSCNCDYNCQYGQPSSANCSVLPSVLCQGERDFTRQFLCSYCFLTPPTQHRCDHRALGCRSTGSPTSNTHWYVANCTVEQDTVCLGKQVFSKRRECTWTRGYSWNTALGLSITLGGFGADRFYLGHWQEGIGKLFSFGGLGVWTLVDVVLVATGYIGPADGSLYI